MAKPELGTKRVCLECSTKYYDFNRDPIVCPKCGTVFVIATPEKSPPADTEAKTDAAAAGSPETDTVEKAAAGESDVGDEKDKADVISLEDAEDTGGEGDDTITTLSDDDGDDDDLLIDDDDDDDLVIEDDDEDDEDDVSDIVADDDEDEET